MKDGLAFKNACEYEECTGDLHYGHEEIENNIQWIYCIECGWDAIL